MRRRQLSPWTRAEAEARAKEILARRGGGESVVRGCDGKIRDSDTIPPSEAPFPPRDARHQGAKRPLEIRSRGQDDGGDVAREINASTLWDA